MRAVTINRFGNSSEFELTELPKPNLLPGHVIIRVAATSVNPLDYKLRQGVFPDLITNYPMVLHGDVAGEVESVADDVRNFKVGDKVYGCVGGLLGMQGALADYVLANSSLISNAPTNISIKEAAALPLIAETAFEALVEKANIKAGQTVLIHGGTGGVGHIAIQVAKAHNAKVFTTVSSDAKAAIAADLGADVCINYKKLEVVDYVAEYTQGAGFDVVFDTVGGENLTNCMQAVASFGSVVSVLGIGEYDISSLFLKNASLHLVMQPLPLITGEHRDKYSGMLAKTTKLVEEGKITPLLDKTKFTSITDAGRAHDYLESGKAVGKVVIENNL